MLDRMASKLIWVLVPVALAAAIVALLALRGRLPSRPVLNVWFSLLLLIYVLATAGLGLFWVANQQLPVFDWHYVFGYSLLALLALHLGFNWRVVWQTLRHRRLTAAAAPSTVGRRPVLGALGLAGTAVVGGVAFLLGLRHGRTELRVTADAAAAPSASALALVEQFHAYSSHSRAGLLRRAPSVDWGQPPPPFKAYPGRPRIALPPPRRAGRCSGLDLASLGTLLWHSAGVNERRGGIPLRTAPSSGALFATELYVAVRSVPGLAAGLWHYDGSEHVLTALREGVSDAALLPPGVPAAVLATAIFRRSGHKYGDRTYRYVLADLGHALENLCVAADACGCTASLQPAFDEAGVAVALDVDEREEGVLAHALLRPGRGQAALSDAIAPSRTEAAAAWRPGTQSSGTALGVTDAVHRATSLRAGAGVAGPIVLRPTPAPLEVLSLPQVSGPEGDALAPIARRRSRRRFVTTPLAQQDLAAALQAMARPAPQLSAAVRLDVVTQAVQSLAVAAWRYEPRSHALHLRVRHDADGLRRRSRAAALDQDVIGDAAAVFVLSIDRAAFAADPHGAARGYRHAFVEAGRWGERLYLAAEARGLGVCAVGAFYDDEAAALVGVDPAHEWVVHFAALGMPA